TRCGIYLGCGEGMHDFPHLIAAIARAYRPERRAVDASEFFRYGLERFHAAREAELEMHITPAHLADTFDLQGPNYNCLTACAASSQAIGEATEMTRGGAGDTKIAGVSHDIERHVFVPPSHREYRR